MPSFATLQTPSSPHIPTARPSSLDDFSSATLAGFYFVIDNLGYFGYNPSLSAYVEVISYTKLLRDAKKRNKILFDKLNLPMTSFSGQ